MDFARARAADPDEIVLVGWSLGGVAAAALAIHASRYGLRFARTVCLAGAFMVPDPITGKQPAAGLPDGRDRCPFSLLHGTYDDVIPIPSSRDLAAVLRRNNWPVELVGLAADHGSIAGASYDRVADRYAAADDDDRLAVAADVAAHIAAVH